MHFLHLNLWLHKPCFDISSSNPITLEILRMASIVHKPVYAGFWTSEDFTLVAFFFAIPLYELIISLLNFSLCVSNSITCSAQLRILRNWMRLSISVLYLSNLRCWTKAEIILSFGVAALFSFLFFTFFIIFFGLVTGLFTLFFCFSAPLQIFLFTFFFFCFWLVTVLLKNKIMKVNCQTRTFH